MPRRALSRRCTPPALRPFDRGRAFDRRVAEQSRPRFDMSAERRGVPLLMDRTPTLVKWATRSRPGLVLERLPLWAADTTVRFLFSLDADDPTATPDFIAALNAAAPGRVKVRVGNSRGKVEACEDGLRDEDWTHVVVMASDDMVPQVPYYARLLTSLFYDAFPEGNGVLHTDDGRTGRKLNTLCVADRAYFDRTGYLYRAYPTYSDGYISVFCDNEYQAVSERLGRACYVDRCIVKHQWIGDGPGDALCRRNESYYARDGAVYEKRLAAGFPMQPAPGVL